MGSWPDASIQPALMIKMVRKSAIYPVLYTHRIFEILDLPKIWKFHLLYFLYVIFKARLSCACAVRIKDGGGYETVGPDDKCAGASQLGGSPENLIWLFPTISSILPIIWSRNIWNWFFIYLRIFCRTHTEN